NIHAIKDSKIPFTLVSARAPMEMKDTIEKLNLTSAQIAFNGGLIFKPVNDSIEKISEHYLPLETVKEVVEQVKSNFPDVSVSTYDTDNWYSEKIDFGIEYESKITSIDPTIVNFEELFQKVTNNAAQKSHGIKYVQNLNNLNKSELAAFGDGHNDIPMLKMVEKPIIMENAADEVKQYSNLITKSNIEDGVAFGIKKFILN